MFTSLLRRLFGDRRQIFRYFDGARQRRADPLVLSTRLEAECPDWRTLLETLAQPQVPMPGPVRDDQRKKKDAAKNGLVKLSRTLFGLEPLTDAGGLTERETAEVLMDYLGYMGDLADAVRPFWSSPPRAAPSPAAGSATDRSAASTGASGTSSDDKTPASAP